MLLNVFSIKLPSFIFVEFSMSYILMDLMLVLFLDFPFHFKIVLFVYCYKLFQNESTPSVFTHYIVLSFPWQFLEWKYCWTWIELLESPSDCLSTMSSSMVFQNLGLYSSYWIDNSEVFGIVFESFFMNGCYIQLFHYFGISSPFRHCSKNFLNYFPSIRG